MKKYSSTTKWKILDYSFICKAFREISKSSIRWVIGYSGQNDQSSPDEIDHPHKTEPELVFSSLIAVTNL
jgi:hypothetical protein